MKKLLFFLLATFATVVMLQAQNPCVGPTNLTATPHVPDYRNVTLNWNLAVDPNQQRVSLPNSLSMNTRIGWGGSTGGAATALPTVRFLTSNLTNVNGYSITAVTFCPGMSTAYADYTIVIWQGGSMNPLDSTLNPGTIIYTQPITSSLTPGAINTVPLTTPLTVDATQELWVSILIHSMYGYPIHASNSDGTYHYQALYGNLNGTNWRPLTLSSGNECVFDIAIEVSNSTNLVQGYNVYCNQSLLTPSPIANRTFVDSLASNGIFQYNVTAVYANNCESNPISATIEMDDDTCYIFDLPFTENFDSHPGTTSGTTNNLPECWHHLAGTYANFAGYPIIYNSTTYASSGSNSLRFYTTTSSSDYGHQVAILPPMDIMSYPMNSLQIEFDGRASATSSNFTVVVGVMDNYFDLTTFVPIDTFTSSSTSYTNFTTNFSQYTGSGAYIALMAPRDFANNYGYIDNLLIEEIPSCPKPRDIAMMSATQTSVTLTWNEMGTAAEWEVEYGLAGFRLGSGTRVQAMSNTFTVTGLSSSSSYDFYVRAVCGYDDTSAYSGPFTAMTECGNISELPYTQNFDAFAISNSSDVANLPTFCWSNISTGTSYSGYPSVYNSSTYANSGVNALRFYIYGSSAYSDQYAVMPALDPSIPISSVMMEYKARPYSQTSTYTFYVIIGVMSDSSDVNTFVPVDTLLIPNTESLVFSDHITLFNNYTGTGRYIAFKGVKPASTSGYNVGTIDDIVLSYIPSCMHPTDVAIASYTDEAVTVNWEPYGSETSWEVVVVPEGSTPESGVAQQTTEHPFTVDMLTPQTHYDVYVRAYCGGTDYSAWEGPVTFRTRCAMTSDIPYEEHFDSYGTATSTSAASPGPMPTCWTRYTDATSPYPYISSTQHIGTGALYLYSTTAYYSMGVSQQLDLSNYSANSLFLSFKLRKTSASYGRLQVGVMTNPDSMETFVLLKNIYSSDIPNTSDWEEFTINLTEQYDTPVYLAFRAPNELTNYVYLDDVVLDAIPTCSEPRNLSVSQIQGTSAMVTWEESLFGTPDYMVQYSELGMDSWSAPVSTTGTFYMLSGLTPNTSYEVRIYSDCASEISDTVSITFATTCLFGGYVTIGDGTTTNSYLPSYSLYKMGYSQQIFTASELGGPNTFYSISLQMANLSQQRHFSIYLMHTSASTASDWLPASNAQLVYTGSQTLVGNSWNTFTFTTPFVYNGTDNLVVIVIDANSSYTSGNTWYVHTAPTGSGAAKYTYNDNTAYSITSVPTTTNGSTVSVRNNVIFGFCDSTWVCARPNAYVSSINDAEVTINWAAGDSESSWAVEYKAAGDTAWTSEGTVSTNTYTFSNLNTGTEYLFRVCALCSSVDSSTWSTTSAFVPCSSISTLPYTQDFESATGSGASHTVDPCLTRGTNSTTAYPYPSSSYASSGLYSLYFVGTSATYSYMALPRMDESIQMDSLMVQFKALKTSAAYYIEVGIMEDPDDFSTFTTLATFSPSMNSTTANPNWEMSDCLTNTYTGTGRYVAFRIPQATTSYIYLDDIYVDYIPSCLHVTNLHLNNVTTNSAEIAWTPGREEQAWYYVFGKKDSVDLETATYLTTTTNPLMLTGLEENTEYEIYVAADCNEPEPSQFMVFRFTTTCDIISSLPYYENFDEFGGVSGSAYYLNCWYRNNTYSTTAEYPYLYTSYAYSNPQSLYFYSLTTSTPVTYNMAVVNELAPEISINTLQARFMLRTSATAYYMIVGVVTDPENPNTFTPVDTVQCSATSTWEEFSVPLSSYTGDGHFIAFKGVGTLYFDDLWIEEIPNCDMPENIVVNGITNHDATITWDEGDSETAWEVYVFPVNSSMSSVTPYQVQNNPTLTVSNLETAAKYNIFLRAVCPGGGYSNFVTTTFTTMCDPLNTLPFTDNFDSYQGTTSTTVNNLPTCWNYINTGTTGAGYPIVYNGSTYAASGSNSIRFWVLSTAAYSDQYAILPQVDNMIYPLNTLQLLFDARRASTSYPFTLVVGVMGDPMDPSTFDVVDTIEVSDVTYEPQVVYFNNYTGTGSYIALKAPKLSVYNEGQVDNIEISLAPSCKVVRDVQFDNISSSTADVLWTPNGTESQWTVQYREKNGTDSTWMEIPVSGMPQTILTNLDVNKTYEVRVQSDCGGGELSDWTYPVSFTTECNPITTLPFSTNFDSYTGTTSSSDNNLPDCWHYINRGSTYPGYPVIYNSATYAVSGSNSLRFYTWTSTAYSDQYAILPAVDPVLYPISTLQLQFDVKKYSTTYATFTMVVGVMTDPYDESTFVGLDTVVVPETTATAHTTYFSNYTGNGTYIALVGLHALQAGVTYNSGSVDNLSLSVAPMCLPVGDITVSGITDNSAEVSWTPNGSESAWWVKYKANTTGAVADSVFVTTTPTYTLTGLTANTNYSVWIKSDCGNGDESQYTLPTTFTTECQLLTTLPFSTNFDSYPGTTSGTTNNLPNCWHYLNTGTYSTYAGYPLIYNSTTYSQSGSNSLRFYTYTSSSTMGDQYAILPGIDVAQHPINTLQIAFDARKYSTSYATFTMLVGVMSDPYDLSTFELVDTVLMTATTFSHFEVQFNNYQGNGAYIALMAPQMTGVSYNSGNIDNLVLDVIPCTVPESLAVSNVTANSADVTWTPGGAETSWNLQYKTASSNWTLVPNLTSPSYSLTNLQANTAYQVQVQANCGSDESDWSTAVTFTTMDDQCAAPTNLHLVDTTNVTAILDWSQTSGVANEWTIYYKKASEEVWSTQTTTVHPYDLYGLEPGTTYTAKVIAHCTNGMYSDPSNEITFTTSTVGVENYELDQTEVYPNPTTGEFRVENSELRIDNVEVYDVYGKLVKTVKVDDNSVNIDLTGNASGIYFTRIYTEKGVVTKRIVKK